MPQGSKENFLSVLLKSLGQVGMAYPEVKAQQEQQQRQSQQDALNRILQMAQLGQRQKEFTYGQEQDALVNRQKQFNIDRTLTDRAASDEIDLRNIASKQKQFEQELILKKYLAELPYMQQKLGTATAQPGGQPPTEKMPAGWDDIVSNLFVPKPRTTLDDKIEWDYPPLPRQGELDTLLSVLRGQGYPQAQTQSDMPQDWPGTEQEWQEYKRLKGL